MERFRDIFRRKAAAGEEYEPLTEESHALEESQILEAQDEVPFSWIEYSIFALIGMAMLWAW